MSDTSIQRRRYDLDWLRILAFALLIYFHAAIPYIPDGIPLINNEEHSLVLRVFVVFLHQFRLALLFFVSGIGVRFAIKHRGAREFIGDRSRRLLIPLLFGIVVLVPPMVYFEKVHIGDFVGSFASFYPTFYTEGFYPRGNLSWHHFWFLAYLLVYSVIGYPVIAFLKGEEGQSVVAPLAIRMRTSVGLYFPIAALAIIEIALRARYPGFPTFIDDWANVLLWYAVFLAGFTFASNEQLIRRAETLRHWSLLLAILFSFVLFLVFWSPGDGLKIPKPEATPASYVAFSIVRSGNIWCWIMTCVGYASCYLARPSRSLSYLNDAVYPLFCLHLPTIVVFSFYVVPLELSVATKFAVVTTVTLLTCIACYELVRRFFPWLRMFIGMKSQ